MLYNILPQSCNDTTPSSIFLPTRNISNVSSGYVLYVPSEDAAEQAKGNRAPYRAIHFPNVHTATTVLSNGRKPLS